MCSSDLETEAAWSVSVVWKIRGRSTAGRTVGTVDGHPDVSIRDARDRRLQRSRHQRGSIARVVGGGGLLDPVSTTLLDGGPVELLPLAKRVRAPQRFDRARPGLSGRILVAAQPHGVRQ